MPSRWWFGGFWPWSRIHPPGERVTYPQFRWHRIEAFQRFLTFCRLMGYGFLFPWGKNKQKWWTPWNVIALNKKLYYPKCLFLVWANQAVWGCSSLRIGKHMEIHHPTSQAIKSLQKYLLGMNPKDITGTCDIFLKSSERYILYTCNLKKCKWMNQDPGITSQVLLDLPKNKWSILGQTPKKANSGTFTHFPKNPIDNFNSASIPI